LFTEQPAPPHQVAEVQLADVAPAQAPTPTPASAKVATPEVIASPAPVVPPPAAEPASPPPANTPASGSAPPAPAAEAASQTITTAKAQRQKEVEQTLLELTRKARVKQQEQQQQQAEADAAKYGEAGEIEEAQKVIGNPALPANVRAALLKRLQAKQAKQGKNLTAKSPKTGKQTATTSATNGSGVVGGVSGSGRSYATAPIVPLSQAQMRLRLGQLIGRNLNFAFPLSVPAPITSMFGWRIHPISGSPRFHRGIDFGAPLGTPIVAAKAGRVETADSLDGYGLTVILQHGKDQQTLYGHMSQIFVQPGQVVKKGQLLGLVGSTGNSTGPHLHFEIHELTSEGWVALDPAIAMNGAIALAQNPQLLQATSRKPQSFNLAMSGLLDINLPTQLLPNFTFGNSVLSGLPIPTSLPQAEISPDSIQLSLALLPPALPELGWLISPLVDNLAAEISIPLPGLFDRPQQISFQPLPSLSNLPAPVALRPNLEVPNPTTARLATTKPLAGLTIAEQMSGAVRLTTSQKLQTTPVTPNSGERPRLETKRLQLSNRRIKPLNGG